MIELEITIVCESVRPGCEFRALTFDRETQQFYGGSGTTALEALAWCLDEYIGRVVYGLDISPARISNATPGSRFPKVPREAAPAARPTIAPTTTPATKKRRSRKAA